MSDTVPVPCIACRRSIMLPASKVRAAKRAGRRYVAFCSRQCNVKHVASEGSRQQEEVFNDRYSDSDSSK